MTAKRLCRALNDTVGDPSNLGAQELAKTRSLLLETLFGKCDPDAIEVEPPFWCDYGYNISLGKGFYCNYNCCILGMKVYYLANDKIVQKLLLAIELVSIQSRLRVGIVWPECTDICCYPSNRGFYSKIGSRISVPRDSNSCPGMSDRRSAMIVGSGGM